MKKIKCVVLALVLCLATVFCTGCSEINVMQTTVSNSICNYQIEFTISSATKVALQSKGNSLMTYFNKVCEQTGIEGQCVEQGNGDVYFIAVATAEPDWLSGDSAVRTISKGVFFNTVKVSMPNPLGVIYKQYQSGNFNSANNTLKTLLGCLKFGLTQNGNVIIKPISEAFEISADAFDGLVLNYLVGKRFGMQSSAQQNLLKFGDNFVFSVVAGNDGNVEYTYLAPVGWHWYLLIAFVGIAIGVILYFATSRKKAEVGALDDNRDLEKLRLLKARSEKNGVPFVINKSTLANQNVHVFDEDLQNDESEQDDEVCEPNENAEA